MNIRSATAADADAIAEIYAHHVAHGTASFDLEAPDVAFWVAKIGDLAANGWPFLIADSDGTVAGYAYATQLRDRPGYRYACEDSIYVHPERTGEGIGRALLSALLEAAQRCGFRQMIAVAGGGEPASVGVHVALGFREVGRLHQVGFKHGKVLDTVYLQRAV